MGRGHPLDDLPPGTDRRMSTAGDAEPDLHCSAQTRQLGELPAGSATAADHFLLIELPLPWPSKIESHPIVAALPAPPDGEKLRVLGIRKAGDDPLTTHQVISYRRNPDGPFSGFVGSEATVEPDSLTEILAGAVTGDTENFQPIADRTDVLLCTHGSRDRCCGQFGTLLFAEMAMAQRPNTRFWRTSHTGGHRFAPTGITFPDGLTWSFLDAELLTSILDRSTEPATLAPHFRGCAGIHSRPAQIADAVMFEREGWDWLNQPRDAHVHTSEQSQSSEQGLYEVVVASGHRQINITLSDTQPLPVPVCNEPIEAAKKQTAQLTVTGISPIP